MTKLARGAAAGLLFSAIIASANAAPVMPDFATLPTGWVTDRYEPNSFSNVGTYQGRNNVLGIGITPAEGFNNRIGGFQNDFYNTQGRQYQLGDVPAPASLGAGLYIPQSWSNPQLGNVRSDMWGVMKPNEPIGGFPNDSSWVYPIIGFTNYGGAARLRAWDGDIGWIDLGVTIAYDAWTDLEIVWDGTDIDYLVNDALAYTDATVGNGIYGPITRLTATIMQAYNFCGDPPIVPGATCESYVAHWSNTPVESVPEPGTLAVLGMGLLSLGLIRRRTTRLFKAA